MRKTFFKELEKLMEKDPRIFALTGDLGFIGFDNIRNKFKDRFLNCGASEQAMLDIAVGLAYAGKIPFVYSITPFLIYRGFETVRTYIDHEKLHVILVGSGRDNDYKHDGISHDAGDVGAILDNLSNIITYFPKKKEELSEILKECIEDGLPAFISLKRE